MPKLSVSGTFMSCLLAASLFSACTATPNPKAQAQSEASEDNAVILDLKAEQILQFAMIRPREGEEAKAVRQRYFQTAIPLAESFGDEYLGNLKIKGTLLGKNKPQAIAIYAFPNLEAQKKFQSDENWPEYQKMRKQGWEELHVFSVEIPSDMKLRFDPAKDYTFAAAWTNTGTDKTYQNYLDGIEADFDQIGAKYVAQFHDVTLQSHTDTASDPSNLTLVEWDNGPNLKGLQGTAAYKNHAKDFQTAIKRFDLYWVKTPKGK